MPRQRVQLFHDRIAERGCRHPRIAMRQATHGVEVAGLGDQREGHAAIEKRSDIGQRGCRAIA